MEGDYEGQMVFGDFWGLMFPDICLKGEEKPRKNLIQKTYPTGIEPGSAACESRMASRGYSGGL